MDINMNSFLLTQDLAGEVLLSLKFLPTSQRLEVGVLKIKTVLNDMCSDAGKQSGAS